MNIDLMLGTIVMLFIAAAASHAARYDLTVLKISVPIWHKYVFLAAPLVFAFIGFLLRGLGAYRRFLFATLAGAAIAAIAPFYARSLSVVLPISRQLTTEERAELGRLVNRRFIQSTSMIGSGHFVRFDPKSDAEKVRQFVDARGLHAKP